MGAELPLVSAVVARLADPEINLAAYGGIVMPLAFIIESPIIMLLAASTALSKDWASFARMRRFMMSTSAVLTVLHVLVVFTPLYDVIARHLLGAPAEIIDPGRMGLRIMLPWTWSIAYRRFHQGVLIRFGRSGTVGRGTLVRLGSNGLVLILGSLDRQPARHRGCCQRGCDRGGLRSSLHRPGCTTGAARPITPGSAGGPALDLERFHRLLPAPGDDLLDQYAGQPAQQRRFGAHAATLESLAAWPAIAGLVFLLRSLGIAYNEVVVSLLDEPNSSGPLRRFMFWLAGITTAMIGLITLTPLSTLWFDRISALEPELASLARCRAVVRPAIAGDECAAVLVPGSYLAQQAHAWADGIGGGLPADGFYYPGCGCGLGKTTGFYIGWLAFLVATLAQVAWLWLRSRRVMRAVTIRDSRQ